MKQVIKVSVVNFHPRWGDKAMNLQKIGDYIELAAAAGTNLIVFPEMALTGYDDVPETPKAEKMQIKLAETIPGPSTLTIAELTRRYNMYAVFGMPERDPERPETVYNAVAILGPEGVIKSYRKMHCFGDENRWATKGAYPEVFDTPWGPIGVSICYDTFNYPELLRYARAKGARLHVSCTANSSAASKYPLIRTELEGQVLQNWYFIASANLCGTDLHDYFFGGSSIIGPSIEGNGPTYYAGHPYYSKEGQEVAIYTAAIDLSYADEGALPIFKQNENVGVPDYTPEVYMKMNQEILHQTRWQDMLAPESQK